ncbi:MAG: hypothetical protein LQ344_001130 [Seirophora lacunosa]|nr:MAG: hypothetical protein LQ344_001130 [Seirophora lacunosa]
MDVDEDDGYSDDDLDALPDDTLDRLQEHAITSTQQAIRDSHASFLPAHTPQGNAPAALAGGLERLSVANGLPLEDDQGFPQHPSSDYGDLDDEMLDGEIYDAAEEPGINAIQASRAANVPHGESTQRELWRHQRYAIPQLNNEPGISRAQAAQGVLEGGNGSRPKTKETTDRPNADNEDNDSQSGSQAGMKALQAQILELRRERDELAKAKRAAEEAAFAKAGEIAIVRANQTKTEKFYESKLQSLQKLRQEEAAKQRLEVERALAEKQKIATEKGFLQNDITEGNQQIKSLQRAINAKDTSSKAVSSEADGRTALPTTPQKKKSLKYADGFDYDEIQNPLPYRSKTSTPKAGSKRKRKPINESPVKPLQLSQANKASEPVEDVSIAPDQGHAGLDPGPRNPPATATFPSVAPSDERFDLMQHVMNHCRDVGEKRTFEALSDFAYPSKPNRALSTIFLDKMSTLRSRRNIDDFPVALAQIVIAMWKECVDEQFWKPVRLLLDLTRYILCITPVTTAPLLVDTLLEVLQSTADVNVIPRVRRQHGKFSAEVNTLDCLELLKSIAVDCSGHDEDIIRFWKCMRFDFIAMILNVVQPIEELHVAIALLRRSVLRDTFAMVVPPNNGKQEPSELKLIDLLSRLLVESLKPVKNEEPYDAVEIAELRLSILSLMEEMCLNEHSSLALASSQHVIGRLVWVMNDELDALYNRQYGHEERAELVNQATRILFRLRSDHPQLINMQEKLKVIPNSGGVHKHLIALTRLALSEGVFYEENIEDDVVECAHEMLEDLSSPEEAEALREAFSTARSR